MKKILFVATVTKKHIMRFHIPFLEMLQKSGWKTEVASKNDYENKEDCIIPFCDEYYDVPFERNPLKISNYKSYKILKKIINENDYDIIHCHTPVGAMVTRFASIKTRKKGTKVIYTAHGFHFYKGAPLINWLIYFPVEWICSFFTDVLVVINTEDWTFSKKHMHAKEIVYIPGTGIDLHKFSKGTTNTIGLRESLNIPKDSLILTSVGELNHNKNHSTVIKALSELNNNRVHYVIAGEGELRNELLQLSKDLNIEKNVHLLGFRKDISDILKMSDIFVLPSIREGLNVSLMEAMATGLPCAASKIRGNVDLIDENGGVLFNPKDVFDVKETLSVLITKGESERFELGKHNFNKIKKFSLDKVLEEFKNIYK